MGNTCAPNRDMVYDERGMEYGNMESRPTQSYTDLINSYQSENEKLSKEVQSFKKQPMQNDEIIGQLRALKELLESKQKAQVQHQLEAALHSKATSMVTSHSFRKLLKAGYIESFGLAGSELARRKWVELYFYSAETTESKIIKGKVMLSYCDDELSHCFKRCQVVRMGEIEGKMIEDKSFSVVVMIAQSERALVIGCNDDRARGSWLKAFNDGFKEAAMDLNRRKTVNDWTIIEVEVNKKKLGIRVKEKLQGAVLSRMKSLDWEDIDSKAQEVHTTTPGVSPRGWNPCDLEVTAVNDQTLFASGLTTNYILSAINGQSLRGMAYYKQLEHLNRTMRPYTLTFLKKIDNKNIAFPRILEELLAEGDNAFKSAAYELVQGSEFAIELSKSEDKATTIGKLLCNRYRLMDVLENTKSSIHFKQRLQNEKL